MKKEIWKSIKGWEGLYEISDEGRLRSLDKIIRNQYRKSVLRKGKTKEPWITARGYSKSILYDGTKKKNVFIHRLVVEAFINKENKLPHIDHINGVKTDNRIENLRYVTASNNAHYYFKRCGTDRVYKRDNKWVAIIMVKRKTYIVGHFCDKNDAIQARRAAEKNILPEVYGDKSSDLKTWKSFETTDGEIV